MNRRIVATVAVAGLLAGAAATTATAADAPSTKPLAAPGLDEAVAAAGTGDLTVIVRGTSLEAAAAAVTSAGFDVVTSWDRIDAVAAHGPATAVADVIGADDVVYVEPDIELEWYLDTAHEATRAEEARSAGSPVLDTDATPFDGSGVTIAVVDSGIDSTHPAFQLPDGTSKVRRNYLQVCKDPTTLRVCALYVQSPDTEIAAAGGHGTHVAGIAAGVEDLTSEGEVVRGVAPGADLVGYGHGLSLSLANVNSAFEHILDTHADPCGDGSCPPIKVVNNSWGSRGTFDPNSSINLLVDLVVDEGITVVFANGNDGGDGTTNQSSSYAQNPKPGVIAVANYDDANSGTRSGTLNSSSSRGLAGSVGTYPDISAPGTFIRSACRPWLALCYASTASFDAGLEYFDATGTSMSSPYIAGVVALMVEADPTLTPADVEDHLEDHAHQFGSGYEPDTANADHTTSFDKGHGLVDVVATLAEVLGVTDPGSSDPCLAYDTVVDPQGDAAVLAGITEPAIGEGTPTPDVDIVAVTSSEVGGRIRFAIEVDDLQDLPLTNGNGDAVRSFFTVGGINFTLDMNRQASNLYAPSGALSRPDPNDPTGVQNIVVDRTFPVVFDAAADVAYADLDATILGDGTPIGPGDSVDGISTLWRRSLGALALPADEAVGTCPLLIG